jgi:hypothetical protein
VDWQAYLAAARERHDTRAESSLQPGEREDLRLGGVASASWAAGLAALMLGRGDEACGHFRRAADEYVASWDEAPAGSWGRPIAALKCRLLADGREGAQRDATRALAEAAAPAETDTQRYAISLALLVLERDAEAFRETAALSSEFPADVAAALSALARRDGQRYAAAVSSVLRSFETRDAYLEDARVADTVLVLQALAAERGLAAGLASPLLPA